MAPLYGVIRLQASGITKSLSADTRLAVSLICEHSVPNMDDYHGALRLSTALSQ